MDIRQVLTKYNIRWRDSGHNVSKDNLVIQCPWCGSSDRGEHLSVSLKYPAYYCYRSPAHKGNYHKLFKVLKIPLNELPYGKNQPQVVESKTDANDYSQFRFFQDLTLEAEAYLIDRGFSNPQALASKFRLRIGMTGRWAGRLIIPLTIGWTGRAIRPHLDPRYLTYSDRDGFFYVNNNSKSVVIVEGPLDALRLASLNHQHDIIGKCGKRQNPAWVLLLRKYLHIFNAPDKDVNRTERLVEQRLLSSYSPHSKIELVDFPEGCKDACEMTEQEAVKWLIIIGR